MSKKLEAIVVSGPTTEDNHNLKNFEFTNKDRTVRNGVPDHFDFSWVITSPKTLKSKDPHYYDWKKST